MKTYKVSFIGRLNTSIGITYLIHTEVTAPKNSTKEDILLKVYEIYEHVSNFVVFNI